MNQTTIRAQELLSGDFLVLGNTTVKVDMILESEVNLVIVLLESGEELEFDGWDKITILDDDSDMFEEFHSHQNRDDYS